MQAGAKKRIPGIFAVCSDANDEAGSAFFKGFAKEENVTWVVLDQQYSNLVPRFHNGIITLVFLNSKQNMSESVLLVVVNL